ncbi:N-acetyl-beta-glucosaminyl-glycoprotein 4-beta-N-acetylgalactosaminyltransferase 1-like [Oculina patagonica]
MFQNLASIIPRRRVKTVIWLTALVVVVQCIVFVAVQVRWNESLFTEDCSTPKLRSDISSPQGLLLNEPAASVLELQIQTTKTFTHEEDTPVDSTTTKAKVRSDKNAVNLKVTSPTSNKAVRNSTTVTTSAEKIFASTRNDFGNTTVTSTKKDFSNNEAVTEFGCRQLKNRTSVNGYLNLHEWHGWCGHSVDDLRREPLFPFKPHVNGLLNKFETNVTKRTFSARRIFGYVHPPITGDFIFAISSADGSELWLSTDDDPQHSRKIAYLGDPGNQYGATTNFAQFNSRKGQISEQIRLEAGKAYYVEVLQKQKRNQDHVEVAWKMPGKENLEIIGSQYISQYIDYLGDKEEIIARVLCIGRDHPTLQFAYDEFMTREKYDMRDDFHTRVENLPHSEVSDVLPPCPYHPSYVVKRKLSENEAFVGNFIQHPRVYPDDRTDVNMSHDIKNHISWGNKKLQKKEALEIVSAYMNALTKKNGERFTLKEIVNVEAKDDPKKGTRYFLELELEDKYKGRSLRLSEYVYRANRTNTVLCYPDGFQWRQNVTVSMVITVKNYGPWIKFLISQLAQIYKRGDDRNFFLVIMDFNSSDVDLFKLREKSGIQDRIAILQKFTEFHKTKALNDGVGYIKDPNSIIFTADLHIKFPANIFDSIRKHAVQGRSFYSPAVLKLKCGYSITHQQAYWEMMGYGLFGAYKSDWDSFGGLDEVKFTTRWGGEDWDLMDRALGANLEVERLRLPKLYHYYHERKSDWYENARL